MKKKSKKKRANATRRHWPPNGCSANINVRTSRNTTTGFPARRWLKKTARLFSLACRTKIPPDKPGRGRHKTRLLRLLDSICSKPLVIFRKTSMGTRSAAGAENIGVFASLTQTAKLQDAPIVELFSALLTGSPSLAQAALFNNSA